MIECKASMHYGKELSKKHNLRDYNGWNEDGHIDPNRTPMNEILVNADWRDIFEEEFKNALEKYNKANEKKHPDRVKTMDEYYKEKVKQVQEGIFQFGDHETYEKFVKEMGQEKADEFYKEILKKDFEQWKKDNPSMRVLTAALHMDEVGNGTPHLHVDFIPVAENKRGMEKSVNVDGALRQLGFTRDKEQKYGNTPYKQWIKDRREKQENYFQQWADELLGKDVVKIIPSEHSSKPHQETWEHRETQKGKEIVKNFVNGKNAEKIKAAEEIIANADKIAKALTAEAEIDKKAADKRIAEAVRMEKVATKKQDEVLANYNAKKAELQELSNKVAAEKQEVEKRERAVKAQERMLPDIIEQKAQELFEQSEEYQEYYAVSREWIERTGGVFERKENEHGADVQRTSSIKSNGQKGR